MSCIRPKIACDFLIDRFENVTALDSALAAAKLFVPSKNVVSLVTLQPK